MRSRVLALAGRIRAARASVGEPIPVKPVRGQCPPCGQRSNCAQARH